MKAHFDVADAPGAGTGRRIYDATRPPGGFQLQREAA